MGKNQGIRRPERPHREFRDGPRWRWLTLLWCLLFVFPLLSSGCDFAARPEPLLRKANEEWIKGRNHRAVELYKAVLEKYPTGPYAEEALFRLGEISHYSLENSKQAILYFQELLQMNPHGPYGAKAQKYIAEIVEFTFKDYDQAVIEYQNLINKYDQTREEKAEHQFRIASAYYKMQNYEQARVELEVLLEEYPETSWAEESEYKLIEILYTLERCPDARKFYDHFMEQYPQSKYRHEVEFLMASCYEEEGNLAEAFHRFQALEDDYPYPVILKTKLDGLKKRMKKQRGKKKG